MAYEAKLIDSISSPSQGCFLKAHILLRILAFASSLAATFVLITSKQEVVFLGITARYNDATAYSFMAAVDIAVCVLSVLSLIFVCLLSRTRSSLKHYFVLFLIDMVIMLLMISACAAASAIGYAALFGQNKMAWIAVCDQVGKFCNQVAISVGISYVTFVSYLTLTVISASKLMSS